MRKTESFSYLCTWKLSWPWSAENIIRLTNAMQFLRFFLYASVRLCLLHSSHWFGLESEGAIDEFYCIRNYVRSDKPINTTQARSIAQQNWLLNGIALCFITSEKYSIIARFFFSQQSSQFSLKRRRKRRCELSVNLVTTMNGRMRVVVRQLDHELLLVTIQRSRSDAETVWMSWSPSWVRLCRLHLSVNSTNYPCCDSRYSTSTR